MTACGVNSVRCVYSRAEQRTPASSVCMQSWLAVPMHENRLGSSPVQETSSKAMITLDP